MIFVKEENLFEENSPAWQRNKLFAGLQKQTVLASSVKGPEKGPQPESEVDEVQAKGIQEEVASENPLLRTFFRNQESPHSLEYVGGGNESGD